MEENIPGYPGYHITKSGKVYSNKRRSWKILKTRISNSGYEFCYLSNSSKTTIKIHTLVLLAYVGPRPENAVCRHLDGNKLNNHLSNLKWGTHKENSNDKILHGTKPVGSKTNCNTLVENQILEIFNLYLEGTSIKRLAKKFNVKPITIKNTLERKTWRHVRISDEIISQVRQKMQKWIQDNPQNIIDEQLAHQIFNKINELGYINIQELIGKFGFSSGTYKRLLFSRTKEGLRQKLNFNTSNFKIKPRSGIFNEDIPVIFDLYLAGHGLFKLAKKFSCDKKTIKKILTRESRAEVKVDLDKIEKCKQLLFRNRELSRSYVKEVDKP